MVATQTRFASSTGPLVLSILIAAGAPGRASAEDASPSGCGPSTSCRVLTLDQRVRVIETKTAFFNRKVTKKSIVFRPRRTVESKDGRTTSDCNRILVPLLFQNTLPNEIKMWVRYELGYIFGSKRGGFRMWINNPSVQQAYCQNLAFGITGTGSVASKELFCVLTTSVGDTLNLEVIKDESPDLFCLKDVVSRLAVDVVMNRLEMIKPQ